MYSRWGEGDALIVLDVIENRRVVRSDLTMTKIKKIHCLCRPFLIPFGDALPDEFTFFICPVCPS